MYDFYLNNLITVFTDKIWFELHCFIYLYYYTKLIYKFYETFRLL